MTTLGVTNSKERRSISRPQGCPSQTKPQEHIPYFLGGALNPPRIWKRFSFFGQVECCPLNSGRDSKRWHASKSSTWQDSVSGSTKHGKKISFTLGRSYTTRPPKHPTLDGLCPTSSPPLSSTSILGSKSTDLSSLHRVRWNLKRQKCNWYAEFQRTRQILLRTPRNF